MIVCRHRGTGTAHSVRCSGSTRYEVNGEFCGKGEEGLATEERVPHFRAFVEKYSQHFRFVRSFANEPTARSTPGYTRFRVRSTREWKVTPSFAYSKRFAPLISEIINGYYRRAGYTYTCIYAGHACMNSKRLMNNAGLFA